MSWLLKARIAVAVMGIVVWAYAVKVEDPRLRLTGIVLLAVSLLLRWFGPRRQAPPPSRP